MAAQSACSPKADTERASTGQNLTWGDDADDEVLMERIQTGDRTAYRILVDRYGLRLRGLARRFVGTAADADDVVQDVFVKLWQRPRLYTPARGRFSAWVRRMVVNRALDYQRRRSFLPLPDGFDAPDTGTSADAAIAADQDAARVMRALRGLPARQQTALVLTYFDDQPNRESAAVMGMKIKAFESLLLRARSALRRKLDVLERNRR